MDLLLQRPGSNVARRMVSGRILDLLTDLSVITECARQISLWSLAPDVETGEIDGCGCKIDVDEGVDFFSWTHALQQDFALPLQKILPLKAKLFYPEHKRRSPTTVTAMRNAEDNLEGFWSAIDAHFEAKTGTSRHRVIENCLQGSDMTYRTLAWHQDGADTVEPPIVTDQKYHPMPSSLHDESSQITKVFDRLCIVEKSKSKTRGVADPIPELTEDHEKVPAKHQFCMTQSSFKVPRTVYDVFRALISSSSEGVGDVSKSVKWAEFTRAMSRIGFSVERLQGSVWQSTPERDLGNERGIHFHAPHPGNEVSHAIAKRMGRRLGRVYGWHGDTFQLA